MASTYILSFLQPALGSPDVLKSGRPQGHLGISFSSRDSSAATRTKAAPVSSRLLRCSPHTCLDGVWPGPSPLRAVGRASFCHAAAGGLVPEEDWPQLPQTAQEQVEQAREALQYAARDGIRRHKLQLLLPVDQRQFNFLDSEPRDYPCSNMEEFRVCMNQVAKILSFNGEVASRRIGERDNEMDPVGLVYTNDKLFAAVVYPISDTLKQIQELAANSSASTLCMVNPQWQDSGQVVSDFGFGFWKKRAEDFIGTFNLTYALLEQRVGEASNITAASEGGVVRLLKSHPHPWQVFLMYADGTQGRIGTFEARPRYTQLEQLVSEAQRGRPKPLPMMLGGTQPRPPPLSKSIMGPYTNDEIASMDKIDLRRVLGAYGLPTSGKLASLQERLREAQEKLKA